MLLDTKSSAAETVFAERDRAALEHLAISAIAVHEYKFLWRLLRYITKNRWNLFTPESYRLIIQALLKTDHSSKTAVNQLLYLFQHQIRTHPAYHSSDMQHLALYFVSSLAKVQPIRALRLYKELSIPTSKLAPSNLDIALLELQLASYLPYLDLLYKHAERARYLANQLGDGDAKRLAANRIFFSLIQGLLTSGQADSAASMLFGIPMKALLDDVSLKMFVGAYKSVILGFASKSVSSVEKMLGMLSHLPEKVVSLIPSHERYEWLLVAQSNCDGKDRMCDAAAWSTLECMSLVSGVTDVALNAYLGIIAKNSTSSGAFEALKKKMEVLREKFAFLGDSSTFRLLCSFSTSPSHVSEVFYRACRSGQAGASAYAIMFRKVFAEHIEATNLSEFRLRGLLEQFERSQLSWTPALLYSVLSALSNHRMWRESWDLYSKLADTGEIRIDSKCANLAIASAQRLGGHFASLAGSLAKDMELNLMRLQAMPPSTKPSLMAAISAQSSATLNAPNSVLAARIADTLLMKRDELTLEAIAGTQPWMVLDSKTFNLICVKDGYQADLYMRLVSEPFNMALTAQTYLLMIRSCISNGSWDELVKLVVAAVGKHPQAVSDETIDEVLIALMNANQAHLLAPLRNALLQHGRALPEVEELLKRFNTYGSRRRRQRPEASTSPAHQDNLRL